MVYLSVLGLSFGWVRITSKLKALNWGSKRSRTCNIAACIGVFYCNSYFTNSETGAKLASLMANVLNYEMALAQNAKESRPGEFQRCLLRTTLQFSLHEEDILKYKGSLLHPKTRVCTPRKYQPATHKNSNNNLHTVETYSINLPKRISKRLFYNFHRQGWRQGEREACFRLAFKPMTKFAKIKFNLPHRSAIPPLLSLLLILVELLLSI